MHRFLGLFFASIVVQICLAIILRTSWKLFKVTPQNEKRSQDGMSHSEENLKQQNVANASSQRTMYTEIPNINITHLEDIKHIISRPRKRDLHLDNNTKPEVGYDVPERLHFIWIGSQIPLKYIRNIETFRTQNKQYEIYLWVDNDTSVQMLQNKSFHVQKIQTSLLMNRDIYEHETDFGAKSDIFRYEVVFQYGGIYYDIDSVAIKPFDGNFRKSFVAFSPGYRNLSNAVFGFAKNSSLLHFVLKSLPTHYEAFKKDWLPTRTGPAYFTNCVLKYNDNRINVINIAYLLRKKPASYSYHTNDHNWMKKHN